MKLSVYPFINIVSCIDHAENPDIECASQSEIDENVSAITVDIYFKNRFYQGSEFSDSPIKVNLAYLFNPLHKDISHTIVYTVREKKFTTNDSIFGTTDERNEYTYYSFQEQYTYFKYTH
jgi:hypothetical protein